MLALFQPRRATVLTILILLIFRFRQDALSLAGNARRRQTDRRDGRHDMIEHVSNATLGFQKILVLGMPSRSDRRDGMVLTAAMSELKIEFIDGVKGDDVDPKAIPMTKERKHLTGAVLGSWRGHINAIREVVQRNLTSALIMEDDIDWDVRIREQLHDFALSTRALTQPLVGQSRHYADPTYRHPEKDAPDMQDISFDELPATVAPSVSPYGDSWDVLWLGHCGMAFAFEDNQSMAKGRVVHMNDGTVPNKKDLWSLNHPFRLVEDYPENTRVVHHAQEGVCTLAYAVSQHGARRILKEIGLKPATDAFDILLRYYCEGTFGRTKQECLAPNPSFFSHHRAVGPLASASDIGKHGDGFREEAGTDMIRYSVRLNADKILDGRTDYDDQYSPP